MIRPTLALLSLIGLVGLLGCTRADEDKPLPARADPATGVAVPPPPDPEKKVAVVHADRGDVA
jgi:hypothetical protein